MKLYQVTAQGIAVVMLDIPPLNTVGHALRVRLHDTFRELAADGTVRAILIHGAGRAFSAGADIDEFQGGGFYTPPRLPELLDELEQIGKVTIAAVNGLALGGGLELALACHYRFAHPDAALGLPEVLLGIIPGAGGTQRLPRVCGVETALRMITSGQSIRATEAKQTGIVDELFEGQGEFLDGALRYAQDLLESKAGLRRSCDRNAALKGDVHASLQAELEAHRQRVKKEFPGFLAPLKGIDAVDAAVTLPFAAGRAREWELFSECVRTAQARAQTYLFFAEREVHKVPGIPAGVKPRPIGKVSVIGAGTMGVGIAMCFADHGFPVVLMDANRAALDRGLGGIRQQYEASAKRGRFPQSEVDVRAGRIKGSLDYGELADADLVIEAVFESMDLKKQVFENLEAVCKAGAILATNTSTLDVNQIAAVTRRPGDVVGLHFFSPANIMKLLEIVRGEDTAPDVIVTALSLAKRIGKIPAVVGVGFGFVGNRMLEPYAREAHRLLLEGASPRQIEHVLTGIGLKMDPLSMYDLAGIDVGYFVRASRREAIAHDPSYQIMGDKLYALGRYGMKTRRGFYRYEGREKLDDPEVEEIAARTAAELGVMRRSISDTEILERCLYVLINEGAEVLREKLALRASDCDVVWCNGYGFPRFLGGPLHHADELGLDHVLTGLRKYRESLGSYGRMWFTPSPLLEQLVSEQVSFKAYDWRLKAQLA